MVCYVAVLDISCIKIVSDLMHAVLTVYEHGVRVAHIVVDEVALHQEVLAQLPPPKL